MPATPARLRLYTRVDCPLCEEMLQELQALPEFRDCALELVDVDADPVARTRFGHKVPVLMLDGELVCHGRLDPVEVRKALAVHR
ncbi:MAG: glutaredoxin family protein [Proteobacteria bacterium]|nr:glutaredoxin family protein [Pseudomonadota bacterium]